MGEYDFGLSQHHEVVKAALKKVVASDKLTQAQADKIYIDWLEARRELTQKRKGRK